MDNDTRQLVGLVVADRGRYLRMADDVDVTRLPILLGIAKLPDAPFRGVIAAIRAYCEAAEPDVIERLRQTRRLLKTAKAELRK